MTYKENIEAAQKFWTARMSAPLPATITQAQGQRVEQSQETTQKREAPSRSNVITLSF